jgi:endogenous inhibitor of DNA gyrase (YacG/DUF329 family)
MATRSVPCPTCNRAVEWSAASPFRPFCSERCKLIDLGAWASEQHRIPDDDAPGTDDDRARGVDTGDSDRQRH